MSRRAQGKKKKRMWWSLKHSRLCLSSSTLLLQAENGYHYFITVVFTAICLLPLTPSCMHIHINNFGISTNSDICPSTIGFLEECFALSPSCSLLSFSCVVPPRAALPGSGRLQGLPRPKLGLGFSIASEVKSPSRTFIHLVSRLILEGG